MHFDRNDHTVTSLPRLNEPAPYFDAAGSVVGAVTLSSAQPRYEEHSAEYVAAVREGADRITALLGTGHAGPAT